MMTDVGGVPMVTTGDNCGGGGMWAILLVALLGGRGFGGYGGGYDGGRGCGGGCNDELNGRFNALEAQIDHNDEMDALRENFKEGCDINMNVSNQAYGLSTQIMQSKFDNAIIAKDAEIQALQCCCETNRNIDSVKFEAAQNTCEITNAIHCEGEATRGLITQDKIESLRDQLSAERLANSQCAQNAYLVNSIRPYPTPTYPSCNPLAGGYNYPGYGFNDGYGRGRGFNDGCCNGAIV